MENAAYPLALKGYISFTPPISKYTKTSKFSISNVYTQLPSDRLY